MKNKYALWALIWILFAAVIPVSASAGSEKIRVGFPDTMGLCEYNEETDTFSGMCYDFLLQIQCYTPWEYEIIIDTPDAILKMLQNKEIDLAGGIPMNESIKKYADYANFSSGVTYTTLSASNDHPIINSYSLKSMDGATVGVSYDAPLAIEALEYFCLTNGITLTYKYYPDAASLEACIERKETDLKLSSDLIKGQFKEESIVVMFNPQPLYFVTPSHSPEIMSNLNITLKQLHNDTSDFTHKVYGKYFKNYTVDKMFLTDEEKEYIKNHPKIPISLNINTAPIQYDTKGSSYKGITMDILNMITMEVGLEFEVVPVSTTSEALELMQNDNVAMTGGLLKNYGIETSPEIIVSDTYFASQMVLVKNTYASLENLRQEGTAAIPCEYLAASTYKDIPQKKPYPSFLDSMKAVERGDAQFTYINEYMAQYYWEETSSKNLSILGATGQSSNFCFGFSYNADNLILSRIINKFISTLDASDSQNLIYNNIVKVKHDFSIPYFIYSNPIGFSLVCLIFILFLFAAAFGIYMRKQKLRLVKSLTLQKEYELKLREALTYAEDASQSKSIFLSHMSHEMRTPLNGIIGMTNITLEMKELSLPVSNNLKKIKLSSSHLLSLINDILDISRIESGKLVLEKQLILVPSFFLDMESLIAQQAKDKGLTFHIDYKGKMISSIISDELRLKQILINILSNSIKYTEPGGDISLTVETVRTDAANIYLCFVITDTGIGMSHEFIKNAFLPFKQSQNKHSQCGTGLGLVITKNLVEMMGGQISLESEINKGTTVTVNISFLNPDAEKPVYPAAIEYSSEDKKSCDFTGHRVLVAEDNDLNMEIEVLLLENVNLTIDTAKNGKEAYDKFIASEPGYYHAILMDIQMPVMDGLTASKKIRKSDHPDAQSVTIIAMTANAFTEDINQSLSSGMDYHISKPFEQQQLYDTLSKTFEKFPL